MRFESYCDWEEEYPEVSHPMYSGMESWMFSEGDRWLRYSVTRGEASGEEAYEKAYSRLVKNI